MNYSFLTPDLSDKRIISAAEYLAKKGYTRVNNAENADFVLLGVNPKSEYLNYDVPIYAGNVSADNVYDYTKREDFAIKNAYLTAEGALSLAINESDISLINSEILICGFGRIGKALHRYLSAFSRNITVCSRSSESKALANSLGAKTVDFTALKEKNSFDYIFNTVPHPVFNKEELAATKDEALIIDLASFPGGVDIHFAKHNNTRLITARGLPSEYSAKSAGRILGETVDNMIREVIV